jgi:hypothetical protein
VQMEVEGRWLAEMDTEAHRAKRRRECEARGEAYINREPLGRNGVYRETRVQLNERSYTWREITWVKAERGTLCRFRTEVERTLTVATFDGRQTRVVVFNYGTREFRVTVADGDQTAVGSQAPSRRTPLMSVTDLPLVGRRELVGLRCSEHLQVSSLAPPEAGRRMCVTGPNPFPGRTIPIFLAERWGSVEAPSREWHATALRHDVEVNHGIFRGPLHFTDITNRRSLGSGPRRAP